MECNEYVKWLHYIICQLEKHRLQCRSWRVKLWLKNVGHELSKLPDDMGGEYAREIKKGLWVRCQQVGWGKLIWMHVVEVILLIGDNWTGMKSMSEWQVWKTIPVAVKSTVNAPPWQLHVLLKRIYFCSPYWTEEVSTGDWDPIVHICLQVVSSCKLRTQKCRKPWTMTGTLQGWSIHRFSYFSHWFLQGYISLFRCPGKLSCCVKLWVCWALCV